jgi:hypothetical protein
VEEVVAVYNFQKFACLIPLCALLVACSGGKKFEITSYSASSKAMNTRQNIANINSNIKRPIFVYDQNSDTLYVVRSEKEKNISDFGELFHKTKSYTKEQAIKNWPKTLSDRLKCLYKQRCDTEDVECNISFRPKYYINNEKFVDDLFNNALGIAAITFIDQGTEYEYIEIKSYYQCDSLKEFLAERGDVSL